MNMVAFLVRWLCALLAMFVIANVAVGLAVPGFDASIWVLDLRWLPAWLAAPMLLVACGAVIGGVLARDRRVVRAAAVAGAGLGLLALVDAGRFWVLLARGAIHSDAPLPASLFFGVAFAAGAWVLARRRTGAGGPGGVIAGLGAAAAAGLFPVLQMVCFGLTDYRRPADAVLVFGARTYADGSVSDALSDRVRAACALYQQGLAPRLILSGGPGDGAVDEAEAMARMARGLGVADGDLILDHAGLNTRASIANAGAISREHGFSRVLAVSHFYHLPRIKLEAGREGLAVFTVPARQGYPLKKLPWFVARETAAWWVYWGRGLAA